MDDLKVLLAAWKKGPSESLRALILSHDEPPEFSGFAQLKIAQLEQRLTGLKGRAKDPRLSRALEQLLTDVPWSSDGSKGAWRAVFTLVAASGDPRFRALKPTFKVRPSMQEWLANQHARATADLPEQWPPGDAARWEKQLAALPKKAAPTAVQRDEAALLAEVFAAPADDAPRLVYADLLTERGDPRGEFIALQCGAGDAKREKALLKAHGKQWVTAFGPALGVEVDFKRGFPVKGVARFKAQRDAEKYGSLPDWATFEQLTWSEPGASAASQRRWTLHVSPAFRHLVHARNPFFPALLEATAPWALETLATQLIEPSNPATFARSGLFPKLHTLELSGAPAAGWFHGLTSLAHVKTLIIPLTSGLAPWLQVANALSITAFRCGQELRFTRGADGAFSQLEFHVEPDSRSAFRAAQDLPEGFVTKVTFSGEGELKPAVEQLVRSKLRKAGAPSPLAPHSEGALPDFKQLTPLAWLDARHVLVAAGESVLTVDVETRRVVREFPCERVSMMRLVKGSLVVASPNALRSHDPVTGQAHFNIPHRYLGSTIFEVSADGTRVSRGKIGVFDLVTRAPVPPPRGAKDATRAADDAFFLRWVSQQPYEVKSAGVKHFVPLEGGEAFVGLVQVPGALVARSHAGLVKWDLGTGRVLASIAMRSDLPVIPPTASDDGRFVFVPSGKRSVLVATLPDLRAVADVELPGELLGVSLSPDGSKLAVIAGKGFHVLEVK